MSELYLFIDESGDLGKFGNRYFVIAALCTSNPKAIFNIIKKIRQRKLKKSLKDVNELKANKSDNIIREAVLTKLFECVDCSIHIIIVDKNNIKDYLFRCKNILYNYIAGILVEHAQGNFKKISLIIDKKDKKGLLRDDFDSYITNHKINWDVKIGIEHKDSYADRGLQAVDFVAWAVNRKYNTSDDTFYKIIEPKIKHKKELFKKEN